MPKKQFSHLSKVGDPKMVDVSSKRISQRKAIALGKIFVGPEVMSLLEHGELNTAKGPVFQTAIIAGSLAVKKTPDLIPMCHPLSTESCKISIIVINDNEIEISCEVKVTAKTGVEMEALTGVSVAALTVYDMCKAITHNMVIKEIRLVEKSGGKSNYKSVQ